MLLLLFILPLASAVLVFLIGCVTSKHLKTVAVILSLLPLAILLRDPTGMIGSTIRYDWIQPLSIQFHLTIDELSLLFLFLTAFIIPASLLVLDHNHLSSQKEFYSLVLLLEGLLVGFFTARDLALFTIFWESMLLPLYFIITGWGSEGKERAALKFLVYMVAGSTLMVVAVLSLYFNSGQGTFDLDILKSTASAAPYAAFICGVFLLAFAVKTPLFPFHSWLPDAYCKAPIAGTILLSALLSKAGIYGIIRVGYSLFPALLKEWSPLLLGLAITGTLYGALVAWKQNDYKRLLAYSSFSHVNFVLAGLFVWQEAAVSGAILQAINHGITIAALFISAGWLEKRLGTTSMESAGGLAKYLPLMCWTTLIFVLSSVALPGTNNFVGEFLVLYGLFGRSGWLAALLGLTVIFTVVYMLRWLQTTYFGKSQPRQHGWTDLTASELYLALPFVLLIFWIGVHPGPVLTLTKPSASALTAGAIVEPS